MTWIIALLVLGTLVLVHEYGHFVVARRVGVRVVRFSIGFGPVIWRGKRGETEYALSLLPLGGYVKMAGEQREEQANEPWEFLSKPPGTRAAIVAAGPLVNAVISVITLWVVLVIGYPELLPSVGRVMDQTPAQAAGVQVGDRIQAIDGAPIRTWEELTKIVYRSPGRALQIQMDRQNRPVTVIVTPKTREIVDPFGRRKSIGLIGIAPSGAFETYRVGPLEAVGKTISKEAEWASQIGLSLWSLFTGRVSMQESLTGPIGIIYMTSEAVRMGIGPLLYLVSIFSLSLAIFNVFPIPVLDGGHLLFLALEKLRGKPVSINIQERVAQVSMAVLMLLVVFVCANDLQRLGVVDKLKGLWSN